MRNVKLPVCILILLTLFTAACSSQSNKSAGEKVDFSDSTSGESIFAEVDGFDLFALNDAKWVERHSDWFQPEDFSKLSGFEYASSVVIIAFWGGNPTTGYSINLESISRIDNNTVGLTAKLSTPDPNAPQSDVITYAFHAISISRDVFSQLSGLTWKMYDTEGKLLLEKILP